MFSKDLENTYSPGRHYRQCHNALIYSKYKVKSLNHEIYILVTPDVMWSIILSNWTNLPKYGIYLPNVILYQDCNRCLT